MAIVARSSEMLSMSTTLWGLAGLFLVYRIGIIVYRLYFHPLSRYPGPKLFAISHIPAVIQNSIRGVMTRHIAEYHQKYGPIVRLGPNRLGIDGSIAWNEVFAHRGDGRPEFHKSNLQMRMKGENTPPPPGIFVAFHDDHRRQRRLLSHAFSDAALGEQEAYVTHYLDLLMQRLGEHADAGKEADVTRWFNFLTFDIIGDLAWADPFNSLKNSDYHPWVALMVHSIRSTSIMAIFATYHWLKPFVLLLYGPTMRKRKELTELAAMKADKRIELGADAPRRDFMTYVLRAGVDTPKGMTREEIRHNSRLLILAGSETTATALSGLTFFLGSNPEVYKTLVEEIRSSFKSESEITMRSTARLVYLHACLEELLRIYPPAPHTTPRVSPGEVVGGRFIPKGTRISCSIWANNHNPNYFLDPETFAPGRWLPESHPLYEARYSSDNKNVFKPFSFGPRDCVGKNLAYAEMRMTVCRLLWNFDFELVEGQENWARKQRVFFLWEKGPLKVRFTRVLR